MLQERYISITHNRHWALTLYWCECCWGCTFPNDLVQSVELDAYSIWRSSMCGHLPEKFQHYSTTASTDSFLTMFLSKENPFLKCYGSIWHYPNSFSPSAPLSNGQTWKKVFQTILASPYIPGHTLVKKSTANHLGKPKTPPQWRRVGIFG